MLGGAGGRTVTQGETVLELFCGQQLHADLVVEAIAQGKGEAGIVINVGTYDGAITQQWAEVKITVITLGLDLGDAEAGKEVARAVGQGLGAGGKGGGGQAGGQQGGEVLAHGAAP